MNNHRSISTSCPDSAAVGRAPRWVALVALSALALGFAGIPAARATTYNVVLGANRAAASSTSTSTAQMTLGAGSWYELYPSTKAELYLSPANDLGASFTIDDIASVTYRTYNVNNAAPVEFFMAIYTTGSLHGWYEQRVNAEPYLKNAPAYSPVLNAWSTWSTSGPGELTFTDHNNSGNAGFYNAPTLADLQAGAINWSTWPGNPTSGAASVTPIDYGAQSVYLISFQTGSGWSSFESYIDEITINLVGGDTYIVDLESAPDPIYVDDDWAGSLPGAGLGGGKVFGLNAFDTIPGGIGAALTGATVSVAPGNYPANVVFNKGITLAGAQAGASACGRVAGAPSPAVESIISGPGPSLLTLSTGCANGIIDGFSFIGGTKGIESSSGPLTNLQILNNHFAGFTGSGTFLNDSGDDITLHQNNIDGSSAGGGAICHFDQDSFKGLHVTSNCIKNAASGTGMFVDGNHNINPSLARTPLIDGNLFQGNATGANLGRYAFTGGTISNNTFTGNLFDGLQGGIQNTAITGNTFSTNGRSGLALTGFGGAGDATRGAQNSTITLNDFTGNVVEGLFYSSGQFPGTVSTNAAHNNNFVGNGNGVTYGGAEMLNLTCNWWNSAAGPDKTPQNPNPPGDNLAATNALFVQWLVAPAPGGLCLGGDDVTPGPAPSCISTVNPCVTIPVAINRVDTTPMRGFSVTFSLSSELMLCSGLLSITEGTYLNGVPLSSTQFQLLDNGGGSYTVDCAILGLPCGATGDGTLFNVDVTNSGGDGTGTITVTSVTARDCNNAPISASPGAPLSITIDNSQPIAVSDLVAAQKKTGNDSDGTTVINLSFTPPGDADSLMIYRAGFGDYPEYDDGLGVVPATPGFPPPAPWVKAATIIGSSTTYSDETTSRDFWYYVMFSKDGCGNVSPVSNQTGGTLNYHLGDVTNGTPGMGDNIVNTNDISLLGANYGITFANPASDPVNYLDVGPTTDFSVNARPTTDNKLQFEDLIMFAINYFPVTSKPGDGRLVDAAAADAVRLDVPALPAPGQTFVAGVNLSSSGAIQGVSLNLDYDRTIVEPVAVEAGELMTRQGSTGLVLSSAPGNVDAAVLGSGATIAGSGELARVTFRVLQPGDARVSLRSADARDTQNNKVSLNVAGGVSPGVTPVLATFLGANYPNPFHGSTTIPLGLKTGGATKLAVYDVAGRLVRTLLDGPLAAGSRVVEWDGRDNGGRSVSSGFYVIRLTAPDDVRTRSVKIVR